MLGEHHDQEDKDAEDAEQEQEAAAARTKEMRNDEEKARKRMEAQKKRKLSKQPFEGVNWPFPARYKNKQTVRLNELVAMGMPRKQLVAYLTQEIRESESCRSMPFAFLLITFYALSAIGHENGQVVSDVQKAIETSILKHTSFGYVGPMGFKSMDDIGSHSDFWSWMQLGFLPTVFNQNFEHAVLPSDSGEVHGSTTAAPQSNTTEKTNNKTAQKNLTTTPKAKATTTPAPQATTTPAEETPAPAPAVTFAPGPGVASTTSTVTQTTTVTTIGPNDPRRGMFLQYNRIMGGVRLRRSRSEIKECPTESDLFDNYQLSCVGGLGYELDPEKWDVWHFPPVENGDELWLHAHTDVSILHDTLRQLEFIGWLDNSTSRIEIGIPVYNGEYGLYVYTKVSFFFSRAGHIWKDVSSSSTFADWWPKASYVFVDLVFMLCIIYIIGKECLEIRHMLVTHGHLACLRAYVSLWNTVDWFAVFSGGLIIGLFRLNFKYTQDLNGAAAALGRADRMRMEAQSFEELLANTMTTLENELQYAHYFRYAMAVYPLVIILRVFKAFAAQARLAVVTDTLVHASVDLIHFGIVFFSVFGALVISSVALFGRDVESFVTPARALNQLFRALLGDIDWEKLRQAGRYEAMSFYVIFRMLLGQIMFNLLISIIMDSYNKVKSKAQGAEMIWEELMQEFYMRFGSSQMVPYWKIVAALAYDEKVDTLVKVGTRPHNQRTTYLKVLYKHGQIMFSCFQQYPKMEKTGHEQIQVGGHAELVIVCDGRGGFHEITEGTFRDHEEEIPITLDEHGKFHWYYDTNMAKSKSSIVQKHDDLLKIVTEAETGLSAQGMVTMDYLQKTLDQMSDEQALEIIEEAITDFYLFHRSEPGPDELRNMVMHLDHRTSKCLRAVMGEPKRNKNEPNKPLEEKATVGLEMAKVMDTVKNAIIESTTVLEKSVPPHLRERMSSSADSENKGPESANFEELHVGHDVIILSDMRRIITTCFDAGLSSLNSEKRKECAGCHGRVVDLDKFDKTVCVRIAGVGKMWFAPGALLSPHGLKAVGPPVQGELQRREREKEELNTRQQQLQQAKKRAVDEQAYLGVYKMKLELEIAELQPTAEEAVQTCEEMQRRVDKQMRAKERAEHATMLLEKKQARLLQEGRNASLAARLDQEALHGVTETRNEYFDQMRQMVAENQALRAKLETAQENLAELQVVASADARAVAQYENDVREAISDLKAARTAEHEKERTELAWIVGRADHVRKELENDGWAVDALPHLVALRNVALEASHVLQEL